jgi:hypothetical protein
VSRQRNGIRFKGNRPGLIRHSPLLRYSVDLGGPPRNLSVVPNRNALPRSDRFPATRSVPKVRLSSLSLAFRGSDFTP